MAKLALVLDDILVTRAIAQARQPLSDAPLEALYPLTAHNWTQQAEQLFKQLG